MLQNYTSFAQEQELMSVPKSQAKPSPLAVFGIYHPLQEVPKPGYWHLAKPHLNSSMQ